MSRFSVEWDYGTQNPVQHFETINNLSLPLDWGWGVITVKCNAHLQNPPPHTNKIASYRCSILLFWEIYIGGGFCSFTIGYQA